MPLRHVVLLEATPSRPELREELDRLHHSLTAQGIRVVPDDGDGLIALPYAVTSLGPVFQQLDDNDRPCGLLDTGSFYSGLLRTASDLEMDRFVRERQRGRLVIDRDPAALVRALVEYLPPETRRQAGAFG